MPIFRRARSFLPPMSLLPLAASSILTGSIILSLSVVGCGEDGDGATARIIHVSPTASAVDVTSNGGLIARNLSYGEATEYEEIEEGVRFEVRNSRTSDLLLSERITLTKNVFYTILVGNVPAALRFVTFTDNRNAPEVGQSNIRVIHAAPSAPAVDVYLVSSNASISSIQFSSPAISNLSPLTASSYLTVPSGTARFLVTPTGSKEVVIDSGTATLNSTNSYTALALDDEEGGGPFSLSLLNDTVAP